MARRPDDRPPSLAMVAAGGFGVLAVIAFVAAVAFGTRSVGPIAGERLAVRPTGDGSSLEVAVARCPVERVTSVAVTGAGTGAGDDVRWRITSAKGSIDERYRVGAAAPTGFTTDVGLAGAIGDDPVAVAVTVEREGTVITDRVVVEPGALEPQQWRYQGAPVEEQTFEARSTAAADCPGGGSDRGVVVWLFGAAAVVVVVTFLGMVGRWWGGRSG